MQNLAAVGWGLFPSSEGIVSSFDVFGDMADFVKTATSLPDKEAYVPRADSVDPTGTFTYAGTETAVRDSVKIATEDFRAPDANEKALLWRVSEKESLRAYSSVMAKLKDMRVEELDGIFDIPDIVRNGTLSIDASGANAGAEIAVSQNADGNTEVSVNGGDSLSFGRIARVEVTGSEHADSITVAGRNFTGGVCVNAGAGGDSVNVNVENVFGAGTAIDTGAGSDSAAVTAANSNVSATGGADNDLLSFAQTNLASAYTLNAWGGTGDDVIDGSKWTDSLYGEDGNDIVRGGEGRDTVYGGDGADFLSGQGGDDLVYGGAGADTLMEMPYEYINSPFAGVSDDDSLWGGDGSDDLIGGAGNDSLHGEGGNDCLFGMSGQDSLSGGDDDDRLYGGAGRDILRGGTGKDYFAAMLDNGQDRENSDNAQNCLADFSTGDPDTLADLSTLECVWREN